MNNEEQSTKGCETIKTAEAMVQVMMDILSRFDTGEMVQIIKKTPEGIEWLSSLQGGWFMDRQGMESLLLGWNGVASVYWSWNAVFANGTTAKAFVVVPPHMMQEVKDWLDSQGDKADEASSNRGVL